MLKEYVGKLVGIPLKLPDCTIDSIRLACTIVYNLYYPPHMVNLRSVLLILWKQAVR